MSRRELSAAEHIADRLRRIEESDAQLNTFVHVDACAALAQARALDLGQSLGPLAGVPIAVKDCIDVADTPTLAGSSSTSADPRPRTDAQVVTRLRAAGAVVVGKVALEEFGIGPTSEDSPAPHPKNPWDPRRSTGGSSSGSAVATAAGLVPLAIGTDTAGSIRLPAAHCGVLGLKPTYGAIPMHGVTPLAPSLDHIGLVARTTDDLGLALVALGLAPVMDRTHGRGEPELSGTRIGVVVWSDADVAPEISSALDSAIKALSQAGADCSTIALPALERFQQCGSTILHAEAYRLYRRLLQQRGNELHPVTRRRLLSGHVTSERRLGTAYDEQARLRQSFESTMARADLLIAVTTFAPPGPRYDLPNGDDSSQTLSPRMPFNVVGAPALAVPFGFTDDGLPLSVQLVASHGRDMRLVEAARALEAHATPADSKVGPRQRASSTTRQQPEGGRSAQ